MREPQDISTGRPGIYKFKNGKPYGFRSVKVLLDMLNMLRRLSMIEIFRVVYKFD